MKTTEAAITVEEALLTEALEMLSSLNLDNRMDLIKRIRQRQPRATTPTEEALSELRRMFPGKVIFLKDEVEWWAEDSEPCRVVEIGIDYPPSNQRKFRDDTLTECMAQVREWKDSQP